MGWKRPIPIFKIKQKKMKRIYTILIVLVMLTTAEMSAQQDAQYTQYMYNTASFNPAYAGTRGTFSLVGLHRSQWIGLDGAPRTQTLGFNTPVGPLERIGLGLSIINDDIGPTHETYLNVDVSYMIPVSENAKLSLGIKAGGHLLDVNFNELNKYTQNDLLLQSNIDNKFSPIVGAGLFYYTDKFYLGYSIPNFLETQHFDESSNSNNAASYVSTEKLHHYLITGYVFDLSDNIKFKPAALGKLVNGAPFQVDISANILFNDKFYLGAAWRWSAALSGMAGFQISDSILLGVAYDRETTELGKTKFDDGSFEVFLRYELFNKQGKLISPRFF